MDNGSLDGTKELLKEEYPWVRALFSEKPLGFARAANQGMEAARGEYLALLNNDTEVKRNWLTALRDRLNEDSTLGFCASKMIRLHDRRLLDGAGDAYSRAGNAFRLGWGLPDSSFFQKSYRVFGACGAAAMYRKSMLERIGLMDEDLNMYYEDVDISFRAQMYGYPCEYVSDATVYHVGSASSGEILTPKTLFLIARNSVYVVIKNYPSRLLLKNLHRVVLSRVRSAYRYFHQSREMGAAFLKGVLWAPKNLLPMMKKRRVIQNNRNVSLSYIQELLRSSEEQIGKAYAQQR